MQVITPNPKTSGGARWNYLAAWAYALEKNGGSEDRPRPMSASCSSMCRCWIPARAAPPPPSSSAAGDVLLAWENEAFLALEELGPDKFDIVVPSLSILAEPPVAVVDKIVDKKGTRAAAQAYLEFLYTPAQEIIAKNYYRPIDKDVAAKYESKFPKVKLVRSTTRSSAAGARRRRITSAMAAPSTRSTSLRRNDLLTIGRRP